MKIQIYAKGSWNSRHVFEFSFLRSKIHFAVFDIVLNFFTQLGEDNMTNIAFLSQNDGPHVTNDIKSCYHSDHLFITIGGCCGENQIPCTTCDSINNLMVTLSQL